MTLDTWCGLYGISKVIYNHRFRKVRQACLYVVVPPKPKFVERFLPDTIKPGGSAESHSSQLISILRDRNGLFLELLPTVSSELVNAVLKGISILSNARNFKKTFITAGCTDLRRGIEGLAGIKRFQFYLESFDEVAIFLFCGKRRDRIKALI